MKIGILSKAAAAAAAVFALNNLQAAPKEYFALPLFDKDTGAPIEMVPKYYDSIIKDKKYHHLTLDEWFNAPHATANVYGLRRYAERGGIVPSVAYVGNFAANTCGGMSRGADNSSSVNLGLGVNLKELTDIEEQKDSSYEGYEPEWWHAIYVFQKGHIFIAREWHETRYSASFDNEYEGGAIWIDMEA